MAAKHDLRHFLRFSLLAVFSIACLAVLGLASLVLDGPGSVAFGQQVVGKAVTRSVYYVGDVTINGVPWTVRMQPSSGIVYASSGDGTTKRFGLTSAGDSLVGIWRDEAQTIPVSLLLQSARMTFHLPEGRIETTLRKMYR